MPDAAWIIDGIRALGVAGGPVFAVLWWLERIDRRASQAETRELLIQVLTVTSQAATSTVEVTKAVAEMGEGAKETADSLTLLGQLVRSLASAIRQKRGVQ